MRRRTFLGRTTTALIALGTLGWSVLLTGCSAMTDLFNWIPVGLSAVSSIISLLSGAGIVLGPAVMLAIGAIQAGLTDLKLAIVEYNSTTPPPVGALAKIDTFLSDLVSNLGNVISELPPSTSNVITLVIGLVVLILDTIKGFMGQIPVPVAMVKTNAALTRVIVAPRGQPAIIISPATNLTRRHFIKTFNSLVDAGGHQEARLAESPVQHL